MPIPQDQTVLKSYFETGKVPTQAQFAEWIDTMFALFQQAQTTANNAVAIASAITTGIRVFGLVSSAGVLQDGYGCATSQLGAGVVRITFDDAFADTNYTLLLLCWNSNGDHVIGEGVTKALGHVDVELPASAAKLNFVIFHS